MVYSLINFISHHLFNSTPGERAQHSREPGKDADDEEHDGAEPATPAATTEPGTTTTLAGHASNEYVGVGMGMGMDNRKRIRNGPCYGSSNGVLF